MCGLLLSQEGPAPLSLSCCRYRFFIDCMTGWSPEAASPAHVIAFKPPRRRPRRRCQQHYQHYNHQRKNEPGHRGHLWTVCSCCNLALIVAERSKIGTALKFSAWYDDMNAEWSARAYIQVLKVCENSNRASSIVIYVCVTKHSAFNWAHELITTSLI